ncbi:MAG: hypothetical protein ACLGHN_10920 [Bacteriovoracia bacterium]
MTRTLLAFSLLLFSLESLAQGTSVSDTFKGQAFGKIKERVGLNYFSFWEGPSLEDGQTGKNELNRPLDSGLSLFNLVSVTYKLNKKYNFDLQNRLEYVHTQETEWRFQGLRAGISGLLLKGEKWSLKGALNTDVPGLNGRDAGKRTVLFNPGLFAGLNWAFSPKWSLYTILSPRLFFYKDDEAVEDEWLLSGRSAGEKPRAIIQASPTINYAFNDSVGMRTGLDLQFRQFVESEPGYFKRWPTSWTLGPTLNISKMLNVYTYVQTWPFDGNKLTRETASVGMWLSGVLF